MGVINFNRVIAYSKAACKNKSQSLCATYVKKAFTCGGCTYIAGNGWNNQNWCEKNGFVCIGEFEPYRGNPRNISGGETEDICIVNNFQFPKMGDGSPYVQQTGDVCLIKHGRYGHICYAMSTNIGDWASDFFQRRGPYCYDDNKTEMVQFWRHISVLGDVPTINANNDNTPNDYVIEPIELPEEYSVTAILQNQMYSSTDGKKVNSIVGKVLGTHMPQRV